MQRWNKADWLLCFVAALFFCLLALKLRFPDQMAVRALFFASEAALVGGVADWFAVTALFKKPLGIPYHTALLPRKRQRFTEACVRMVQDEFFSKKKLLLRIKKLNLLSLFLGWMKQSGGRALLAGVVLDAVEAMLAKLDRENAARAIESELHGWLRALPQEEAYRRVGAWIVKNRKDEAALDLLLRLLLEKLQRPETKEEIWDFLQGYMERKSQDFVTVLFTLVAQVSNVINFEEAAEILQKRLTALAQQLMMPGDAMREGLLEQLRSRALELTRDETWQAMVERWRDEVCTQVCVRDQLTECLEAMIVSVLRGQSEAGDASALALQSPLAKLVVDEIDSAMALAENDAVIQHALEQFLYDLVSRSVLQAQAMIGVIVHEVLGDLSDAEMNRLICGKVEQDLLWIRMNGSIVGAAIGLGIFFLLEFAR